MMVYIAVARKLFYQLDKDGAHRQPKSEKSNVLKAVGF